MSARIFLLSLLLALVVVFYRFNSRGHELPEGCDVFGFLYMSEAVAEGKLFKEHTERPFLESLVKDLEGKGFQREDYAWAITPHAYHVESHTGRIINQYPPGTSVLLAIFPKDLRPVLFAPLMILLMALIPFLAVRSLTGDEKKRMAANALLFLFFTYAVMTSPMLTEMARINSLAPTFGLLIAAGLLVKKRPELAIFLVSLSLIFRVANILLIPPLMIYAVFRTDRGEYGLKTMINRSWKAMTFFLFSGFGLYLLYVFTLLGNPFYPTYSEIDRRSIGLDILSDNLIYYFVENTGWLWLNLTALALLVYLKIKHQVQALLFYSLLSLPVIAYLFFLFHFIKTPYYPYAPSLVLLGASLSILVDGSVLISKRWKYVFIAPILALAVMGFRESTAFHAQNRPSLQAQAMMYKKALGTEDVIWAELKSSTVEYAIGTPGMRLQWGKAPVILETVKWLRDNGRDQAILISDLDIPEEKVRSFLEKDGIHFTRETNDVFGVIYRIKAN